MNKKIIGILVVMLLIASVFSFIGTADENEDQEINTTISRAYGVSSYDVNLDECVSDFIANVKRNMITVGNSNDVLDQKQTEYCGYGWGVWDGKAMTAQSFIPTLESLTKIDLMLWKKGTPTELKVAIRDDLDGDDLTSIIIAESDISTSTNWFEFDFDDVDVIPGNSYYILMIPEGASEGNTFYWAFGYNDPYFNGDAWTYTCKWKKLHHNDFPGIDFCFKTYGKVDNPSKPDTPSGPEEGEIGEELSYSTSTTDPNDKQVSYKWDWGDGATSEWLGPFNSGETVSESHVWTERGVYAVKVKAKNIDDFESGWSNSIVVGIPTKNEGIDQEQDVCDGQGYGIYGGGNFAQSFVPTKNSITKVELYIHKKGNPEKITISIRDDLNGIDLTSIDITGDSIDKVSWVEFDFPDIGLTPSQTYYIIWNPETSSLDNNFYWNYGENNRYESGLAWVNIGTWDELTITGHPEPDFCFKTYYANTKPKNTAINTPLLNFLENHPHLFPLLQQLLGLQ